MPDRFRPYPRTLCCLALLVLGIIASASAEVQMDTQQGKLEIAAGDVTFLVVRIVGISESIQPTITVEQGDVSGLISRPRPARVDRIPDDDQQLVEVFTYRIDIEGVKPGSYALAASIDYDGQKFTTKAQEKITVRAPTDAEKQLEPTLSIAVEKNEIYLGELLPIQVIISTSPRTKEIASNVFPEVESDGFIMQPLNRHFQARQDAAGRRLSFFEGHCEALKAGDLRLGPATYRVRISYLNRSHGRSSARDFRLQSAPVTVKVKPLPAVGEPGSFTGTVGRFKMEIDAAPLKVKQGNPIELSLTISGSGNLPSISEPAFSGDASVWKLYGSKRADSRDLQRDPRNPLLPLSNEGSVTFTRMVVPIEVASEIPSFEFSFFDPDSAEYRTLRTDAIPIEVTPDPNAKLAATPIVPDPGSPTDKPEISNKMPPVEGMQDILSIRDLADQSWLGPRTPLVRSKRFWTLQAPPAAALLALVFVAISRRFRGRATGSGWSGIYPPCSLILAKLRSKSQDTRSFYHHAHQFLEARREQFPDPVISTELEPGLAAAVAAIRARHEFLEFGAPSEGEGSQAIDPEEQRSVIRTLEALPEYD